MSSALGKFRRFEATLLVAYLSAFIFFAFTPEYRILWCIENSIALILVGIVIVLRHFGVQLSKTALVVVFLACTAQTLGGYYTFQKVPGGEALTFLGVAGRNNFDRLGHSLCGVLSLPLLECLQRFDARRAFVNAALTLGVMSGIAAIYEEIEWGIVLTTEARTGLTFVATQGDEWDAQADMFCCTVGSMIGVGLYFLRWLRCKLRLANDCHHA